MYNLNQKHSILLIFSELLNNQMEVFDLNKPDF
jgi:hypothetical protein